MTGHVPGVDVTTSIAIERPVAEVAQYAADPYNAPTWYANTETVEWATRPPLTVGSRLTFVTRFLGRRLRYTYEVVEHEPERTLVMRTANRPFPMETSYTWERVPGSGRREAARMTLRNRAQPTGFARAVKPLMGVAMRRANRKDLQRLKSILERPAD